MSLEDRRGDILNIAKGIKEDTLLSLNSSLPGIIQSFDPVSQTAVVQVAIRKRVRMSDGVREVTEPLLVDVPVCFLGGGSHALTFPVQAGDECLLFFADRCIDAWFQSGGVQNQVMPRSHDLSDGFALVGFRSKPNALQDFNTEKPNFVGGLLIDGTPAAAGSMDWESIIGKPITFPPEIHEHPWGDITDKPLSFPPETHSHGWNSVTDKPTSFPPTVHGHSWGDVTDKPSSFPPEIHEHGWSEIAGKPLVFPPETHGHSWSDVTSKPTSFPPEPHPHGNITNDGKIGTSESVPIITGVGGVLQAGAFGSGAGQFCEGDDPRLSTSGTHIGPEEPTGNENLWIDTDAPTETITPESIGAMPSSYCPYGIGDYLTTKNPANPSTRWLGTTWEAVPGGTFIVAANDTTYPVNATGGEAQHTLTQNEIPSVDIESISEPGTFLRHFSSTYATPASGSYRYAVTGTISGFKTVGGGLSHNNLPPYLSAYVWLRLT